MTITATVKTGEDFVYEFPADSIPTFEGVITAFASAKDESDFPVFVSETETVTEGVPLIFTIPASRTSAWVVGAVIDMDVRFSNGTDTDISETVVIRVAQGVSNTPLLATTEGTGGSGITSTEKAQLNQATSDIGDLATKVATLKDRVDGFTHLTQDQRDTIDAFIAENGGARGVISRVLINDAKHSFTPADAATLAEVAARMGRTDEEILEIVATAPANADTMQKLADLLQGQADLNTRIDNLPETPEGITQAHIDAINANTAKTGITAQEQAAIVANTAKTGITPTQAAAILKLIDDLEAANLRIDEAEALRRITPQEIADIAALNERVNITPEQADKIAASDAIHADLQAQINAQNPKIQLNTNKISYSHENQLVTISNTQRITDHDTIFGARLRGDWESGEDLVSLDNTGSLSMGDLVTQDGKIFEALIDITSVGSSFAPDADPSAWRGYELQTAPYDDTGIKEAIAAIDVGGFDAWNAADTYNTGDVVIHASGIYEAIADNVISAVFEPATGQLWQTGWRLVANAYTDAQADERILAQITPALITQEAVSHPDVISGNIEGKDDTPAHDTQTITITDANANPLRKDAITFTARLEELINNGGFDPAFSLHITQGGQVLADRTFRNPSDLLQVAFAGYLNAPFDVVLQGTYGTDTILRRYRVHYENIMGARSGVLYDKLIEAIHNETDADFTEINAEIARIKGLTDGVGASLQTITERVQDNTDGIADVRGFGEATRGLLQTDVMQAVQAGQIIPTETPVIAATPLNTELGGGNNFAEQIKDGDIGTATQFITRFTNPSQVLQYGAGRVADVFNGRFRVFDLIPAADAFDTDTPKFLTNTAGQGTNDRPLEIPLGDNQNPKHPLDSTRTLATGYPVAGENKAFSNFSLQGYVRVNDTTNYPIDALALEPFTGQTQTRVLPNVIGVSLVAIDRGTGVEVQIRHANGGSVQNQPTNNARLFLEVGYVETITTPAVARGQEAIDMGAFTGQEVIAIDVGEAGTDAVKTAQIVLPDRVLDTGYFLNEANRTGFADDNPAFDILISEPETALTSEIMGRLDGADEFLGLFERTNHHEDGLDFGRVLYAHDPKSGERFAVEKTSGGEGVMAGVASGVIVGQSVNGAGVQFTTMQWRLAGGAMAGVLSGFPADQVFHGLGFVVIENINADITFRVLPDSQPITHFAFKTADLVRGFQGVFNSLDHTDSDDLDPVVQVLTGATTGEILIEATFSKMLAPNLPTE